MPIIGQLQQEWRENSVHKKWKYISRQLGLAFIITGFCLKRIEQRSNSGIQKTRSNSDVAGHEIEVIFI